MESIDEVDPCYIRRFIKETFEGPRGHGRKDVEGIAIALEKEEMNNLKSQKLNDQT